MRQAWLCVLFGSIGCVITAAADFATESVNATCKLFDPASTATCFFIRREPPDQALYLVTAAHVLEWTKGDTAIVVLRETRANGSFPQTSLPVERFVVTMRSGRFGNYQRCDHTLAIRRDGKPLWTRHASDDSAVLRLTAPPPVPVSALPLAALADEARLTAAGLHICSSIFVLTFPERFEANDAGFAVARQGIIASHPFRPIQTPHTFLADFTTFAGDSGGPVFVAGSDGHPLLVGMVLAQFRHDERVTMEYEERTIHHPLGLGTVLHAQFIRDTIEQAAKQPAADSK